MSALTMAVAPVFPPLTLAVAMVVGLQALV